MAVIQPQQPDFDGNVITWTAASGGGDQVPYDPANIVIVDNRHTGSQSVTFVMEGGVHEVDIPDRTQAVTNGANVQRMFRLGPNYVNPTTGNVHLTYSGTTLLFVAVIRAPQT